MKQSEKDHERVLQKIESFSRFLFFTPSEALNYLKERLHGVTLIEALEGGAKDQIFQFLEQFEKRLEQIQQEKIAVAQQNIEKAMHPTEKSAGPAEVEYLETHVADHCNLTCAGCTHFSPLGPEKLINLESYIKDIRRFKSLVPKVRVIRLLGGEPLLHPQVTDFTTETRAQYPDADIRICTNGVLLLKKGEEFWKSFADHSIGIDITDYGLTIGFDAIQKRANEYGIPIDIRTSQFFYKFLNEDGNSNQRETFAFCRANMWNVPFLYDGKIYGCPVPANFHRLKAAFPTKIHSTPRDYLDIYSESITGEEIARFLWKPLDSCKWCKLPPQKLKWKMGQRKIDEWL